MKTAALPPAMDHEGPTLRTLHTIEAVLRNSVEPLGLDRIGRFLPRRVAYKVLREAVEHYKRLGFVAEGSKGVLWTLNSEPEFWKAVQTWKTR
jgi:hypothetical protein